ncbi:MAG: hypothetical protein AVO35_00130 [Candidatus Aegiribacteria sp. MLS_C]|nr:MAG: hypothetical protein AVO35_00130 [Candidatus Aegiribacteria sp. MLS_C]
MLRGRDIDLEGFDAFILDMDGVVTSTASVHARAWKRAFDEFLAAGPGKAGEDRSPFEFEVDYLRYVDGKPRYEGARDFLESRGISITFGSPEDPPGLNTVCAVGNLKNGYFHQLLEEDGASTVEATVDFVKKMKGHGKTFAVISSSRNARAVLESAGVSDLFQEVLGGVESQELGLRGKPEPDIFLEAAERLGVPPDRAVVVEDSQAGVQAGSAGGFALVVGIGSGEKKRDLLSMGADMVVPSLDMLEVPRGAASALSEFRSIQSRLTEGEPYIFLDFDGTLTPIVRRPEDAVLPQGTADTLRKLSSYWPLAVISGRDLEDVRCMVGIDGIIYAGNHGFEVQGAAIDLPGDISTDELLEALDSAEEELGPVIDGIPGARLERKGFAIALHFRESPPETEKELRKAVELAAGSRRELRMTTGKKIFELRPDVDWDKGRVLEAIVRASGMDPARVVPVYVGDDTTDEDAFRRIRNTGIGILVTDRPPGNTAASYTLRDTVETGRFLERLLELAEWDSPPGEWRLRYEDYRPGLEGLRETLCATGNGYFVSRGAAPECDADRHHYPGTYIGGCYNRRVSHLDGMDIENESIVNMPNWLPLTFRIGDGPWLDPESMEIRGYRQELDMSRGVLDRWMEVTDGDGRTTRVSQHRFCHMGDRHMAALRMVVHPVNWSGEITVRTALDAGVSNAQVKRYRQLDNHHLETVEQGTDGGELIWAEVETNQSRIRVAVAARTRFLLNGDRIDPERTFSGDRDRPFQDIVLRVEDGNWLEVEKTASVFTSRDQAVSEPLLEARREVGEADCFRDMLRDHELGWQRLWRRCHIETDSEGEEIGRILNLHIFHLVQTVSPHSIGTDVGVPPRGLHGEAYRGLIMWDELFIFPFLDLRIPDLTRTLLLYRYRRMRNAALAARRAGHRGVMFPWQSGSNGREEAQILHLNPESGRWIPDNSRLQRHINIAVAYNTWKHFEVTGDMDFLSFYGCEMLVEICRFWASTASFDDERGRYGIRGVMGPDEFHDAYPDSNEPGLANNAYTNIMTVWVLTRTMEALDRIPPDRRRSLWEKLRLSGEELDLWREMAGGMFVPFHGEGIISQFEGYGDLEEFDWDGYEKKYGDIHRLDRILEAEGDSPNRYKVSKQADVLMLFYLLSSEELEDIFDDLGYHFDSGTIVRNVDYYLRRTAHGSTLSRLVHSWVLARSHRRESWDLFTEALRSDVADIQGGTTHEGIHLGAMAGTVDMVQRCYTGLETRSDVLRFNPNLPAELNRIEMSLRYRGNWINVDVTGHALEVSSRPCEASPIRVGVQEDVRTLEPGGSLSFELE